MKRTERRTFMLAYAAWLFALFAFFMPAATWNPASRFALTRAVAERGSFQIDPDANSTGDRALVNGHWYSGKPPIVSFAAVPAYAVTRALQSLRGTKPEYQATGTEAMPAVRVMPNKAYQQALYACSLTTSGLAGVAVGLLLFELLRRRTTSVAAFVSSTLILLGTPLFPYSTSFYSHVPAAALLLAAIVSVDQRGERPVGQPLSSKRLRIAGACLALAPGCEYLTAPVVAMIAIWVLLGMPAPYRARATLDLALGGAIPVLLVAWYHTAAYGLPWRTGYSFVTQAEFIAGHSGGVLGVRLPSLAGLHGLTFGNRRGLFYLAPITLLGVLFGVLQARRRRDKAIAMGLTALALLLLLNAGYYMWWGGAAAGPRHLVPALPFLAGGVVLGLRSHRRWVRWMTIGAGLFSIANFVALTAVGIEAPEYGDALYRYAWSGLLRGRLATFAGGSNLGLKLGLVGPTSLIPLLVVGYGGFRYLRWLLTRHRRFRPRARAPSKLPSP
jgi:hypothetical membrane protein